MRAKKREGIVYSTIPDFKYQEDSPEEEATLPPNRQLLYIWIDSKSRNGKTVTLIKGFTGTSADLEEMARNLKRNCGTGGSVKNKEIILQGDFRNKVVAYLSDKGYKIKKAGG